MKMTSEDIQEEEHFVKLFEETLEKNRGPLSDDEISEAVYEINHLFQRDISCPVERYRTLAMRWGYFYKMSFISAGLARFYVLEAVRNSEEFRTFFNRPSLKVLSIGSGPGNDLIGLCSALYGNADFQELDLILVDYNELWKPLFEAMVEGTCSGNYGNASRLFEEKKVNFVFVLSDVLNTDKYKEYLKNIDIVWMKGLLSVLDSDSIREGAIGAVISSMPVGSLLVVLDSPSYHEFENFQDDLKLLYSTGEDSYYFSARPNKSYGPGFCRKSNQIISVLIKT